MGLALGALHAASHADTVEQISTERGSLNLYLPDSADESGSLPLVISLHGYTSSGNEHESYFRLRNEVDEMEFMLCMPNGTQNFLGARFWNATDACCNFTFSGVDDSGFLRNLIETIISEYDVDLGSIHVLGHSNGGFMSHRMACDHADLIASIASLAGATFLNPDFCQPDRTVHALQIHGDLDDVILYDGGCITGCYPGAELTAEIWAEKNGCDTTPVAGEPLNLVNGISGNETLVQRYVTQCDEEGSSEVWRVQGGNHGPSFNANFRREMLQWLLTHRRDTEPSCRGDLNGDEVIDGSDLTTLLSSWGLEGEGDVNDDGTVDGADVTILLTNWGSC
ncbi:MAG: hypothetical protein CMJ33_03030 [Phycisphaerae bacterium]|nr:hypothetical protein [Phycisphaerae bacterium]